MSENGRIWYKAARNFVKAGRLPVPITDTVIEIVKTLLNEEQAKFIVQFKKSSYNSEEIKSITDLDDKALEKMLNDLMYAGAISGIPSRSTGAMIYRVVPFLPGLLEFTLMRGEFGEKDKKLAQLHKKFFDDLVEGTQKNYDQLMKEYNKIPGIARVIPVEEEIEPRQEIVLPLEELSKIIEKYDPIGVATCYCRHRKDLIDEPCKKTDDRKNCFSFGRTAEFLISQGNCCKCCCGTFEAHYAGAFPLMDISTCLASVNADDCVGCGTCVENCNAEAIELEDTIAVMNEDRCVGCGICAHLCPESAITMNRTEMRKVFVPPPKLTNL